MNFNPNVLVFDIETFPMEVRIWQLGEQRVGIHQIVKEWSIAAWAAKKLGDPAYKMHYMDTRCNKDVRIDRNILEPLWRLLDWADIVITQNGQKFDSRRLNARFIQCGMKPPSPYKHLDTYKIAHKVAEFTSHKLEYLTDKLCTKYKKMLHKKYPGHSLWDQCLAGNKKAWEEMERYNKHDVLATEELFLKLRAWAPASLPKVFQVKQVSQQCNTCGAKGAMAKWGFYRKHKGVYQRWACNKCGAFSEGEKINGN